MSYFINWLCVKNRLTKGCFQSPLSKRNIFRVFLLHIDSTYFGGIPPLHNLLYMKPNRNYTFAALSVVEVPLEVVEEVVVAHMVAIVT